MDSMTLVEFVDRMRAAFPAASWDIDNEGQVLIYTGLVFDQNDGLLSPKED